MLEKVNSTYQTELESYEVQATLVARKIKQLKQGKSNNISGKELVNIMGKMLYVAGELNLCLVLFLRSKRTKFEGCWRISRMIS